MNEKIKEVSKLLFPEKEELKTPSQKIDEILRKKLQEIRTNCYQPKDLQDNDISQIDEKIEEIANFFQIHVLNEGKSQAILDFQVGINLLKSCGNIAEASASREITQEHFDKAIDSLVSINISHAIESLSDIEKEMLKIIVDYDGIYKAGELSEIFKEKTGTSYGSFKRTLDKLEFVRLIDTKFTGKGSRGNSREVILRFNPDDYDI